MKEGSQGIKIPRKEALKRIGNYGKYTALTAIGTYLLLDPKKAQAASPPQAQSKTPPPPPHGFKF